MEESQRKWLLFAIVLANITIQLNTNTVSIALPTYMKVFSVDINLVQWVVIGYTLPLCMMMPVSGYLCERYSYRKVFVIGMAGMMVCSIGCASSFAFMMLVVFRFLKGMFAGIMVPSTMAMLYRYLPKEVQASSLGIVVLAQSVGMAIGPTVAGVLLQVSTWHILFLLNVPLALISMTLMQRTIPAEEGRTGEHLDFLGIAEIAVGTGMILVAFTNGDTWGWLSVWFLGLVLAGLALIAVFMTRQFHAAHPLLNFEVLQYRPFTLALLIQCALAMILGITGILSQLYFQTVRGWTPMATGLFLLMPSLAMILGNTVTVRLHKRGYAQWLIRAGVLAVVLGNLGLSKLTLETGFLALLFPFCLRYFGMGMANMPLTNYGLGSVPKEMSGHASSMYNWAKQFTQVVSTNILTVLLSVNLARYYAEAGNVGTPVEGTLTYNLAAVEAAGTDFFYMAAAVSFGLVLSFFIKMEKKSESAEN